jgi:hypothetical protein
MTSYPRSAGGDGAPHESQTGRNGRNQRHGVRTMRTCLWLFQRGSVGAGPVSQREREGRRPWSRWRGRRPLAEGKQKSHPRVRPQPRGPTWRPSRARRRTTGVSFHTRQRVAWSRVRWAQDAGRDVRMAFAAREQRDRLWRFFVHVDCPCFLNARGGTERTRRREILHHLWLATCIPSPTDQSMCTNQSRN